MDSIVEDVMQHVSYLAGEIGCRTIGSRENHAAAEYIMKTFRAAGLEIETQEIACPDWKEVSTRLELGGEEFEAYANTFSPSCEVMAPTVAIGSLAELEAIEITGRVPIFYGDLSQNALGAKRAIYISERDQKIVQLLEERRPAALLTINPSMHGHWRMIEDYDLAIASATVPAQVGLKLMERAGEMVRLAITTRRVPSHTSNIIGRARNDCSDRLVICAHYDTKVDTPGAYDNAAGVAVLLTLANLLAKQPARVRLEWVAFTGEEVYGLGDIEYSRRIGGDFSHILAAINIDGVGPRLASNTVATFSARGEFDELVAMKKAAYPGIVAVEPWPASDHYIFYSHGVPSIALSSVGIKDVYHTPQDNLEKINPHKLAEAVYLARDILLALVDKPPGWGRIIPAGPPG
jgi:Iap family predicted aminopeptidase